MLPFTVNKDTHILAIYPLKAAQSFSFVFFFFVIKTCSSRIHVSYSLLSVLGHRSLIKNITQTALINTVFQRILIQDFTFRMLVYIHCFTSRMLLHVNQVTRVFFMSYDVTTVGSRYCKKPKPKMLCDLHNMRHVTCKLRQPFSPRATF